MEDPNTPQSSGMTNPYMDKDMMNDPQLIEYLKQNPEFAQQLARDFAAEQGVLDDQMSYAEGLRDTATPEGRQAGRVYVAANPLEHIGTGLNRYAGHRKIGDLDKAGADLRGDKQSMLATLMRGMAGGY